MCDNPILKPRTKRDLFFRSLGKLLWNFVWKSFKIFEAIKQLGEFLPSAKLGRKNYETKL